MPEFVKNDKRISPENLVYEWSNIVEAYQSQSGYGKNVLVLNGSILGKSESIQVLVTDPVNNLVSQSFIKITPTSPEMVFYKNDPYYGNIFDSAITNILNLNTKEVQILAAPYYFTKEKDGSLKYDWQLNGRGVPALSDSRTAVFRKPENETGKSVISLQVQNTNRILQQADGSLTMSFEK